MAHYVKITQERTLYQGNRTTLESHRVQCSCGWLEKSRTLSAAEKIAERHKKGLVR